MFCSPFHHSNYMHPAILTSATSFNRRKLNGKKPHAQCSFLIPTEQPSSSPSSALGLASLRNTNKYDGIIKNENFQKEVELKWMELSWNDCGMDERSWKVLILIEKEKATDWLVFKWPLAIWLLTLDWFRFFRFNSLALHHFSSRLSQ